MRLDAGTGTKTGVQNTLKPQRKHTFDQKLNGTQIQTTFNQTFSSPQKKSTESLVFHGTFSHRQQISTFENLKPDHNDSQQKDANIRSKSPSMVLNIPVVDNEESKEDHVQNGECKRLDDLMSNLSISGRESKTQAVHKMDNDFNKKTESLNDSFLKLNISGKNDERLEQKVKKEKDDEGELIERGPVASSKKLQSSAVHPYTQKSVFTLPTRYNLYSGGLVTEQSGVDCTNHTSIIPETVEEFSTNCITNNSEEVITPEISQDIANEDFLSFMREWISKQYEQCDDSISTANFSPINIQLPNVNEPAPGNRSPYYSGDSSYGSMSSPHCSRDSTYGSMSPHCSGDSTYGTLSPDSNVISPMSYASPVSSPMYIGNEITDETLLNKMVTNNSPSDSNLLPNEPIASSDLFDLIEDFLEINRSEQQQNKQDDDFVGLNKPNVGNQMQQNCQFDVGISQIKSTTPQDIQVVNNRKLTTEIFNINTTTPHDLQVVNQELLGETPFFYSVTPPIQEAVNSKLCGGMSPSGTLPMPHVNTKLPNINIDQSWNVVYSVNQFDNITTPNAVTTTSPPEHLLSGTPLTNCVQPNVMNRQNVCISVKPSKQTSSNVPTINVAPQIIYGNNVVPNIGTDRNIGHATTKPDKSVASFIGGDSTKKNVSKPVSVNSMVRNNTPASTVKPVQRQILPAGSEVYETGMSVPAAVRLKSLMKNKYFTVQYVKVCLDLAKKPELLKERLFQLLSKSPKEQNWLLCIYAHITLTVLMQCKADVLTARNSEGHCLLYLACVNHPDQPLIARYIADSLLDLNIRPDEIYDINGNSLLHVLASLGDSHVTVLAELLNVRHPRTAELVCKVNRPNKSQMETPLHVAVSKHSLPHVNCLATVKLLITHGANVAAQNKKEMTPLHYAVRGTCELKILNLLLQSPTSHAALNITDCEHNTALHLATANNSISVPKQKAIISSLIGHGANHRIHGKVALALADTERRQEIKQLFLKK